jgi:hypothetical protein
MMVVALGVLFSVFLAIGVAVPVASIEIAVGRQAFQAVKAQAVANHALTDLRSRPWLDSVRAQPVGFRDSVGPGEVEQLAPGLWLMSASGILVDRSGRPLARAVRGWLVQDGASLGDSLRRPILIRRYRVRRFQ